MVVVLLADERKVQKSGKAAFGGKNNEPGQKVLAVPYRLTYHQQHNIVKLFLVNFQLNVV